MPSTKNSCHRVCVVGDSDEQECHNVASILEARALEIDRFAWLPVGEWTPISIICREISHCLDQIKRLEEANEQSRRALLRLECYVDTDLMRLDARINRSPEYFIEKDHRLSLERDRLKSRLFQIEQDRRALSLQEERDRQTLHNRLLELMNKYWQLQG